MTVRLNMGCGSIQPEGWVNVDKDDCGVSEQDVLYHLPVRPGFWREDVLEGLPFTNDTFDYIVADHSLQEFTWHELPHALGELYRVLKPGGVLRVAVPDLLGAFKAYSENERWWFPQGEDILSTEEAFCTFVTWFGTVKSVFTPGYLWRVVERAGFTEITVVAPGETVCVDKGILELDSRPTEALIMEGIKSA